MTKTEKLSSDEKEMQVISKKMITIALIAPFFLGVLGIIIAYVVTLHETKIIQSISLVARIVP